MVVWPLQAGTIFVMTHDSIGLGEDGPTHQPVEHLASFRAMPNILMMRPGDGNETAGCYKVTAIFLHHLGTCSCTFTLRAVVYGAVNSTTAYAKLTVERKNA